MAKAGRRARARAARIMRIRSTAAEGSSTTSTDGEAPAGTLLRLPSDVVRQVAPGKRDIEQTADAQAEPPKRARTSESAAEPAPQPEKDARPSESAGDGAAPQDDEPAPQDDEAAPQQEEDATPFSRGVALAEINVKKRADEARAEGRTEFADTLEATIVTTAEQREAALVPRPLPENESGAAQRMRRIKELQAERQRNEGNEVMAAVCLLTPSELAEFGERTDEISQVVLDYRASPS